MTWLFPLYWLGAFAVVGPIVFHMWRRTPRGERSFSTLMFLAPSLPRATNRSRVEHWVLMLIRVASLFLLAVAFTRPIWRTSEQAVETRPQEKFLAILVDTSASMRRGVVWDELIIELDQRLANLSPDTLVALYCFDRQFLPVASFEEMRSLPSSMRKDVVRTRLKALKPTWQDTRLGEALVQMARVFQDARTDVPITTDRQIWLASDLQVGSEIVSLQGFEWPDDLPVEIVPVRSATGSNAGLHVVASASELQDNSTRVRVTNALDSKKEQFTLRWNSATSPQISVYVPPGQSRILQPPAPPAEMLVSSLVLEGDDHDFDNRVFIARSTTQSCKIYYCSRESESDSETEGFYLDRVFSAAKHSMVRLKAPGDLSGVTTTEQGSLIVLVQPDFEFLSFVQGHLANGGTVVVASPTPESTLACIKLCGRENIAVSEANIEKYSMLGEIDFAHPLFVPFAESHFSDFTGIRFWKHRTIRGLNLGSASKNGEKSDASDRSDRVLARFDDGDPAIVEFLIQRGRVIVFSAGWQPSDGQFARSSKFPMLMLRLIEYSWGGAFRPNSATVGQPLAWPQIPIDLHDVGSVVLPDATELDSQPLDHPFAQTELPGIYSLRVGSHIEQFAVNLAPDESRTSPLSTDQLEGYGLKLRKSGSTRDQIQSADQRRLLQLFELEHAQKLWQLILIVVIGLLLLETLLSSLIRPNVTRR